MTMTDPAGAGVTLTRKAERYLAEHEPRQTKLTKRAAKAIAAIRRDVGKEIERLLELLDRIDGDADLEATADDEPELGWPERWGQGPRGHAFTWIQPGESDELDTADYEPALAAPEGASCPTHEAGLYEYVTGPGSQGGWARGNTADLEGDAKEDDEEGGDLEPSLGWETGSIGRVMVDGSAVWPQQAQVIDPGIDQRNITYFGSDTDLEGEFDGREPDVDDEPAGDEAEPSDNGIGDLDGLRWLQQSGQQVDRTEWTWQSGI